MEVPSTADVLLLDGFAQRLFHDLTSILEHPNDVQHAEWKSTARTCAQLLTRGITRSRGNSLDHNNIALDARIYNQAALCRVASIAMDSAPKPDEYGN